MRSVRFELRLSTKKAEELRWLADKLGISQADLLRITIRRLAAAQRAEDQAEVSTATCDLPDSPR